MATTSIITATVNGEMKLCQFCKYDSDNNKNIILNFFKKYRSDKILERFSKLRWVTEDDIDRLAKELGFKSYDKRKDEWGDEYEFNSFNQIYPQFTYNSNLRRSNFLETIMTGDDNHLLVPDLTDAEFRYLDYEFHIDLDNWCMKIVHYDDSTFIALPKDDFQISFEIKNEDGRDIISAKGAIIEEIYNSLVETGKYYGTIDLVKWW